MDLGAKKLAREASHFRFKVVKSGFEHNIRTPPGRLGKPDEVARVVVALASDLSRYVHGTLVIVNSGFLSV